jgi:hypothetical protein
MHKAAAQKEFNTQENRTQNFTFSANLRASRLKYQMDTTYR